MTCSKRDECGDIDAMKTVGNAMKRKLDDQDMILRCQMEKIRHLEDMIDAERLTGKLASGIATIEFLILVFCIMSMWAGGQVA